MKPLALDFIKSIHPSISDESLASFNKNATIKRFKKGEIIVPKNQFCFNLYIINRGIVRSYFTDEKNNEFIKTFHTENSAFGSLESLINKTRSKIAYDCLIDCEVIEINFAEFKKDTEQNLEFAQVYIKVLEQVVLERTKKVSDLSTLDATERYLKLKKEIPSIEKIVAQYHIASYLSITPVQLSRIRRKLLNK